MTATYTTVDGTVLNAPQTWRDLPYDSEFAKTTWLIVLAGVALWTFLMYWGGYNHPIP